MFIRPANCFLVLKVKTHLHIKVIFRYFSV